MSNYLDITDLNKKETRSFWSKLFVRAAKDPEARQAAVQNAGLIAKLSSKMASEDEEEKTGFFAQAQQQAQQGSNFSKYWQYILGLTGVGFVFMMLSLFALPFIVISPEKFSILFALGCICFLSAIALWKDPATFVRSLMKKDKLPYTGGYFLSLIGTFWAAYSLDSYIFSMIFAIAQVLYLG